MYSWSPVKMGFQYLLDYTEALTEYKRSWKEQLQFEFIGVQMLEKTVESLSNDIINLCPLILPCIGPVYPYRSDDTCSLLCCLYTIPSPVACCDVKECSQTF